MVCGYHELSPETDKLLGLLKYWFTDIDTHLSLVSKDAQLCKDMCISYLIDGKCSTIMKVVTIIN